VGLEADKLIEFDDIYPALTGSRIAVDAAKIVALRAQGHSWGTIRRETGIGKGTTQRAFYILPHQPAFRQPELPSGDLAR
jgi:hypothetical protein